MREHEAEDTQHERRAGRERERNGGRFESQPPDDEAGDDPADGAEHAHLGEFPWRIAQVVERQRAAECQSVGMKQSAYPIITA